MGHRVNSYRVVSGHGSIILTRFQLWEMTTWESNAHVTDDVT